MRTRSLRVKLNIVDRSVEVRHEMKLIVAGLVYASVAPAFASECLTHSLTEPASSKRDPGPDLHPASWLTTTAAS